MKIGDLFARGPDDEPLRYPFDRVRSEPGEGYFIDASDEPSLLESVQVGDMVADYAISGKPYWEVRFVDEDSGRVWLDPVGDNPYVTGVGAGGARLTDWDWRALSGEAAREDVDRALQRVSSRCVTSYRQLVPLLKGWVAPFFGPNGREGGHYGSDWSYTVGGREGLSPEEIVLRDARALLRFGIDVPPGALRGRVSPRAWQKFVSGSDELDEVAGTELAGEDWSDPASAEAMVLRHPMEPIKSRNWAALTRMWDPDPRSIIKRLTAPERWDDPSWVEEWERVADEVYSKSAHGDLRDVGVGRVLRRLASDVFGLSHPRCPEEEDPYSGIRLLAVKAARKGRWEDVLRAYERDLSHVVRSEVADARRGLRDEAGLVRMEASETHPSVLRSILYGLSDLGRDPLEFVDADPGRYAEATSALREDSWLGAYARSLQDEVSAWRRQREWDEGGWRRGLERRKRESGDGA